MVSEIVEIGVKLVVLEVMRHGECTSIEAMSSKPDREERFWLATCRWQLRRTVVNLSPLLRYRGLRAPYPWMIPLVCSIGIFNYWYVSSRSCFLSMNEIALSTWRETNRFSSLSNRDRSPRRRLGVLKCVIGLLWGADESVSCRFCQHDLSWCLGCIWSKMSSEVHDCTEDVEVHIHSC